MSAQVTTATRLLVAARGVRSYKLKAGQLNLAFDLLLITMAIGLPPVVIASHWHDVGWAVLGAALVWGFAAALLCHYDASVPQRGPLEDVVAVTLLVSGVALFVGAVGFGQDDAVPPALLVAALLWPSAVLARLLLFRPLAHERDRRDEVLIVGTGPLALATRAMLEKSGVATVRGHLAFAHDKPEIEPLGGAADLERVLRSAAFSEVYLAGDAHRDATAMQAAVHVCEQLGMPFALPAWSVRLERARPVGRGVDDGFVHFLSIDPRSLRKLDVKHAFDLVASALALLLLAIPMQIIAALIKLDSPGPVLFHQVRVGRQGRLFSMLKFRTMVRDAESLRATLEAQNEQAGPVFKMRRDPRITRVGWFLRKYSLDELPQLVNVLRGEMSLVGPRPPLPAEVAQYASWQLRRLSVRPGLTCIWQVSGRNQISFDEWMLLDLRYIDTWKLSGDLSLIVRTIPAVIRAKGAS